LYYNLLNWEIKKVELFLICFTDIDISLQWDISPKSIIIFNLTTTIWILSTMVTCAWCHVYCRRYCTGEYESCNNFLNCVFHFRVFLRTRTSGISAPCRSACSCVLVFCYYYYLLFILLPDKRPAWCCMQRSRRTEVLENSNGTYNIRNANAATDGQWVITRAHTPKNTCKT